jgi:hypothetical protein
MKLTEKHGHWLFAALAFGIPLLGFVGTLTRTVPFWDSGEYIATSKILGLPHPPGNPVYTMLGRMMCLIPIDSVAVRVNFMSALASALACLFTFLFTVRILRRTFAGPNASWLEWTACEVGGLATACFVAFSSSFWDSAIEAEVYSLSSFLIAFTVWLAFNWWDRLGEAGNDKRLILIVYLLGVSTGVHLGTVLVAPGLLVLFWIAKPSHFQNSRFLGPFLFLVALVGLFFLNGIQGWGLSFLVFEIVFLAGVAYAVMNPGRYVKNNLVTWWTLATVVGFTVQIFLLIRSQQAPAINEGDPSTLGAWLEYLSRKQYGPSSPFIRRADVLYQIDHMYLRYIREQWHLIERLGQLDLSSFWVRAVNSIPFALFFMGAWWNWKQDRKTFWVLFAIHLVMGPGMIFYLNFTDHEVRERDYFFTNSYHFIAVWMGMGVAALLKGVAGALGMAAEAPARAVPAAAAGGANAAGGGNGGTAPSAGNDAPALLPFPGSPSSRAVFATAGVVLVVISLLPMRTGWFTHDRSRFFIAHDYAYNMLAPLEPGAVVFTNGDNDTFPLWYIQEVEDFRRDVRVVNLSLLNTPWYIRQLRDQEPKVPISFTDAQLDVMGPYQDERTGKVIWVKDLAVQDIVKTNEWRKPLYLAVTVPDQMDLEKRLTLEGLVFRLQEHETSRAIDVPKTLKNIYEVFKYDGLLDKNRAYDTTVYKDENAYRLVQNYTAAHVQAAYQLQINGELAQATRILEDAAKISPDFPGLLEYLGRIYEDTGRREDAEKLYREGMRRFPGSPEFHYRLGVMRFEAGHVEEGISELRRATELSQQYFDWFSALFTALWQSGRYAEAVDVLRTWVRAHPEDREGAAYLHQFEDSLRLLTGRAPAPPPGIERGR